MFIESTANDIERIKRWVEADPYHKDQTDYTWWLTGNGMLSFRIDDQVGPTMYVRTEIDRDLLRIHIQFAPESEVSRSRTVKSIVRGISMVRLFAEQQGLKGFVFQSTSPMLILFMMKKFGFAPIGNDDHRLLFEGR